ncbi:hypothetical protein L1765_05600 [Microaerobacter geothermalis]|uniref:hypothetical protein n=1 Tax=Microaerobacter geothermalis TaxID=674972 RepID=UPI001F3901E1|nr:hypothetical protein [Microaerobacter geothermalis]MCF6093460.1 hypothetical protein [Microaerobacter geothermalis]
MTHLRLKKKKNADGHWTVIFHFAEHPWSPSNLVIRKLFYGVLQSLQDVITHFEVEYSDYLLAQKMGLEKSVDCLLRLGATKENIIEKKEGNAVISRLFKAPMTEDRFHFFDNWLDLEQFSNVRFFNDNQLKIEIFYTDYIKMELNEAELQGVTEKWKSTHVPVQLI